MSGRCRIAILCLLLASAGLHAADPVVLRMNIKPDRDIRVGQPVTLELAVLGLDSWANIPSLPGFSVDGAYLVRTESQGRRLSETIDGESYTGQGYRWLLVPQRAGVIEVPPTPVQVERKVFGAEGDTAVSELTTPPVSLQATVPPGAEGIENLVSTRKLTATQVYQPAQAAIRAGDGVTRTVTLEAQGVAGMALPPLLREAPAGLAVYPGEPEVHDKVNRNILESGVRVESVTYVPAESGQYTLPDIVVHWWDLAGKTLRTETLEGITLEVAMSAEPGGGDAAHGAVDHARWPRGPALGLFCLLAITLVVLAWRHVRPRWQRWRVRRADGEAARFRRFAHAAHAGDPAALQALLHWLDRLCDERPAQALAFVERYGDAGDPAVVERFLRARLVGTSAGDGTDVVRVFTVARKRCLAGRSRMASTKVGTLPGLNP